MRILSKTDEILKDIRAQFDKRMNFATGRAGLYANIIQLIGAEQFSWKGLPETINSHYAERNINSGLAAAYIIPENVSAHSKGFTISPAAFVGVPNQIGETDKIICKGVDYDIELDRTKDDVIIIKNNDYYYSEYQNLEWFADMLARTDESEKALIIWSKMHPIAKAQTGIDADRLKEVIQSIIDEDDLYNIIDDNSKTISPSPASRDDSVLRLTDENAVEKMHFLSEFHYELIRRYCTLYNMPFRTNSKSAQSLESELHNTDIFSQIINANRLKCRKDAAEKINAMFGYNVSVDYSELLKKENEVINSNVQEEINEAEIDKNVSRETTESEVNNENEDAARDSETETT